MNTMPDMANGAVAVVGEATVNSPGFALQWLAAAGVPIGQ